MKRSAAIEPVIGHLEGRTPHGPKLSQGSQRRPHQRRPRRRRLQLPPAAEVVRRHFVRPVADPCSRRLGNPLRLKITLENILHGRLNRHVLNELRSKPTGIIVRRSSMDACEGPGLADQMIAERDNETVKVERTSTLVIVAKARIWAGEGWQVVITDARANRIRLRSLIICWRPERIVAAAVCA